MQNIKDTFYIALRDRLAALNPARTVTLLGNTRPAVVVNENELSDAAPLLPETFYLAWKESSAAAGTERLDSPILEFTCAITYWTQGSDDFSRQDRGRTLAALDAELLTITIPPRAALKDYSQAPALDLATNIWWTHPTLNAIVADGAKLTRTATLQVFAHAEVGQ